MTIDSGTRLGPYEIIAPIGAGGMGEVYRARDTRLDRSVAVKVLPAQFANDAQLKLRFEREARTISQLSHPHICTLFDVGANYLVMELLDGETLADRLSRGAIPVAEAVRIGIQMADGLDRAHRAGGASCSTAKPRRWRSRARARRLRSSPRWRSSLPRKRSGWRANRSGLRLSAPSRSRSSRRRMRSSALRTRSARRRFRRTARAS